MAASRNLATRIFIPALVVVLLAIFAGTPGRALATDGAADAQRYVAAAFQTTTQAAQTRTNASLVGLRYSAYVQGRGWQGYVRSGRVAGAAGQGFSVEGVRIQLTGMGTNVGQVKYKAYVQGLGWRKSASGGKVAGATASHQQVEGLKIWLTGDIAQHFDIIYRAYVEGAGWQKWTKNGAKSGTVGKGLRIEAIQVKLSPKTAEAAGKSANAKSVRYEAYVQKRGWQPWKGDGQTAGTVGKALRVEGLSMALSTGRSAGSIVYQTHVQDVGWQAKARNGAIAGMPGKAKRVEAVRIKLAGKISKRYDVYYRTHVANYGWLDWAKNGADAGSTGFALRVEALQVVLVKKGSAAPGATDCPTVNALRPTLDGIDISSWQSDINVGSVPADFVIVKATGGIGYTNPYFRSQADATLSSNKLLGLYHYARERGCSGSAVAEADYFCKAVAGYVGKAALVLDWEADALNLGPVWAKKFLDRVHERTGVRPLLYTSKSVTRYYDWTSVAANHKLWVAQYPNYDATGYQKEPWTDAYGYGAWSAPTIFQYTSSGRLPGYASNLDLNLFYGNRTDWRKLAQAS
ncbi:MAG TPA: hypothetical protein DCP91_12825 [Eggerthellaceae bacterium]|nr:hypothetical protein [Eggerthellaceae bacterium]